MFDSLGQNRARPNADGNYRLGKRPPGPVDSTPRTNIPNGRGSPAPQPYSSNNTNGSNTNQHSPGYGNMGGMSGMGALARGGSAIAYGGGIGTSLPLSYAPSVPNGGGNSGYPDTTITSYSSPPRSSFSALSHASLPPPPTPSLPSFPSPSSLDSSHIPSSAPASARELFILSQQLAATWQAAMQVAAYTQSVAAYGQQSAVTLSSAVTDAVQSASAQGEQRAAAATHAMADSLRRELEHTCERVCARVLQNEVSQVVSRLTQGLEERFRSVEALVGTCRSDIERGGAERAQLEARVARVEGEGERAWGELAGVREKVDRVLVGAAGGGGAALATVVAMNGTHGRMGEGDPSGIQNSGFGGVPGMGMGFSGMGSDRISALEHRFSGLQQQHHDAHHDLASQLAAISARVDACEGATAEVSAVRGEIHEVKERVEAVVEARAMVEGVSSRLDGVCGQVEEQWNSLLGDVAALRDTAQANTEALSARVGRAEEAAMERERRVDAVVEEIAKTHERVCKVQRQVALLAIGAVDGANSGDGGAGRKKAFGVADEVKGKPGMAAGKQGEVEGPAVNEGEGKLGADQDDIVVAWGDGLLLDERATVVHEDGDDGGSVDVLGMGAEAYTGMGTAKAMGLGMGVEAVLQRWSRRADEREGGLALDAVEAVQREVQRELGVWREERTKEGQARAEWEEREGKQRRQHEERAEREKQEYEARITEVAAAVQAVAEAVKSVRGKLKEEVTSVRARLDGVEAALGAVSKRMETFEDRVMGVRERAGAVGQEMEGLRERERESREKQAREQELRERQCAEVRAQVTALEQLVRGAGANAPNATSATRAGMATASAAGAASSGVSSNVAGSGASVGISLGITAADMDALSNTLRKRMDEIEKNLRELSVAIPVIQASIRDINTSTASNITATSTAISAPAPIAGLTDRVLALEQDLSSLGLLRTRVSGLEEAVSSCATMRAVSTVEAKVTSLETKVNAAEMKMTVVADRMGDMQSKITAVDNNASAVGARVSVAEGQLKAMKDNVNALDSRVTGVEELAAELRELTAGLDRKVTAMEAHAGANTSVGVAMTAAASVASSDPEETRRGVKAKSPTSTDTSLSKLEERVRTLAADMRGLNDKIRCGDDLVREEVRAVRAGVGEVKALVTGVQTELGQVKVTVSNLHNRVDAVDAKASEALNRAVDGDAKVERVRGSVGEMDKKASEMNRVVEQVKSELSDVGKRVDLCDKKLNVCERVLVSVRGELEEVVEREQERGSDRRRARDDADEKDNADADVSVEASARRGGKAGAEEEEKTDVPVAVTHLWREGVTTALDILGESIAGAKLGLAATNGSVAVRDAVDGVGGDRLSLCRAEVGVVRADVAYLQRVVDGMQRQMDGGGGGGGVGGSVRPVLLLPKAGNNKSGAGSTGGGNGGESGSASRADSGNGLRDRNKDRAREGGVVTPASRVGKMTSSREYSYGQQINTVPEKSPLGEDAFRNSTGSGKEASPVKIPRVGGGYREPGK